eukprot:359804-Chlamydomonas_euryale.AAC.7
MAKRHTHGCRDGVGATTASQPRVRQESCDDSDLCDTQPEPHPRRRLRCGSGKVDSQSRQHRRGQRCHLGPRHRAPASRVCAPRFRRP